MAQQGPVFLAGVDRTGIGLLGELLEAHPNVAVTRRINFWSFYYNRYGDLSDPQNLERCLTDMMRYTRIKRLQPQPERLRRDFLNGEQSYSRLFALLEEQNMERLGKSRWADKSLNSERYADTILSAFSRAKMVHIIRDPRDRYASHLTHRGGRKGKVGGGTALWLWSARLAERNLRRYPSRYKVVQYEALVAQPETFLGEFCDFIGEEYSPLMLTVEPADQSESGPEAIADRLPRVIWSTSVGRYRETLSEREVAFIQMVTRDKMSHYGYDLEPQQLTGFARVVFYIKDYPVNLTRMMLSRSKSFLRETFGRKPSARRLAVAS